LHEAPKKREKLKCCITQSPENTSRMEEDEILDTIFCTIKLNQYTNFSLLFSTPPSSK
jgi:hypothetical protein